MIYKAVQSLGPSVLDDFAELIATPQGTKWPYNGLGRLRPHNAMTGTRAKAMVLV